MERDPVEVLADPTRRQLFELLGARGPLAVGELARQLPVTRPAVSQHLRVLEEAALVTARTEGRRRIYAVDPAGLAAMRAWLERQWDAVLDRYQEAARRRDVDMDVTVEHPPVVKTRVVPLAPEDAFELFTGGMDRWWPTASHSIREEVAGIRFEGRVGGRVVEVGRDGQECAWADVLAWDPPYRFALSWHPSTSPVAASRLEIRFRAVEGGTELRLEHSGWEEFGEGADELRRRYEHGWDVVLEPFGAAAEASAT